MSASRPRRVSLRIGQWLEDPAHVRRVVDEVAEVAALGLRKVRDDHVEDLVAHRAGPALPRGADLARCSAGCSRRSSPTTCTTGWSTWRSTSCTAGWRSTGRPSPRCCRSGPRGGRRRGSTRRVTHRIHPEVVRWIEDIRDDPHHHARGALDSMLAQLAHDLLVDPETQARAERLKERLLDHPPVLTSSVSLWNAFRRVAARARCADPDGRGRAPGCRPRSRRSATRLREDEPPAERLDLLARGRRRLRRRALRRRAHHRHHRTRSSAGTARRPRDASSCTSGATCSSSGSTAPSSAAWSASSSTRFTVLLRESSTRSTRSTCHAGGVASGWVSSSSWPTWSTPAPTPRRCWPRARCWSTARSRPAGAVELVTGDDRHGRRRRVGRAGRLSKLDAQRRCGSQVRPVPGTPGHPRGADHGPRGPPAPVAERRRSRPTLCAGTGR